MASRSASSLRGRARTAPRVAALAIATIAICVGGCSSGGWGLRNAREASSNWHEPTAAAFERVPVVQFITAWGSAGSAVQLDAQTFLTARHVLPRRGTRLEVRGRMCEFERLATGEGAGPANDWALVRIADMPPAPAVSNTPSGGAAGWTFPTVVDADARPEEDERVYLVGFWRAEQEWTTRQAIRAVSVSVIPTRVIDVADSAAFPTKDLLFARADAGEVFLGASGGPAVAWDARHDRFKVVGVYVGAAEYTRPGAVGASAEGEKAEGGRVQIVRRLPAKALEAWRNGSDASNTGAESRSTPR